MYSTRVHSCVRYVGQSFVFVSQRLSLPNCSMAHRGRGTVLTAIEEVAVAETVLSANKAVRRSPMLQYATTKKKNHQNIRCKQCLKAGNNAGERASFPLGVDRDEPHDAW